MSDDAASRGHVLMVATGGGCTRVHKEAAALADRGWKVDLLTDRQPAGWGLYGPIYGEKIVAEQELWRLLVDESEAELIHYHNEPDGPMRQLVEGASGRPVIFDVHDMTLFKRGLTTDSEYAFSHAAAVVHVSREIRDAAVAIFPHECPIVLLENYPLRRIVELFRTATRKRSVVYVGGMVSQKRDGYWRHRYWHDVDEAFGRANVPVAWLARNAYNCDVRDPRSWHAYGNMLGEMRQHGWGLVGSEVKRVLQRMSSPNKAWEYLALGLPLLALNQPRLEILMGGRAGVYGETVDELIEGMRGVDWHRLHREALAQRRFMEDQLWRLEDVYERLLRREYVANLAANAGTAPEIALAGITENRPVCSGKEMKTHDRARV